MFSGSAGSNLSGIEGVLIGLAAIAFFVVRQFGTRRLNSRWTVLAPLALAYFGLQGLNTLDQAGWLLLAVSLSLGVGLGFLRGLSFRVWTDANGEAFMRGGMSTLVLWLATFAVKALLSVVELDFGLAAVASSTAELLLPAAATIAAQYLVVYLRARDGGQVPARAS
jgi:hypothetical protein